ncbi:MAG: cytidylate kinase-like family protein [Chloroflexota bacterium]
MPVVTIRGQLGSGAPEIGRLIADKLHADYVDREIIAKVAELLNRKERDVTEKEMPLGSLLGRIAAALGHMPPASVGPSGEYTGVYLPAWEMPLDDTRYLEGLKSIIRELAMSESIVIRGRGSQFILKHYPGALHVLVVSPLKLRGRRVMEDMKLDEESAKKEIARFDSSRHQFIKKYFNAELENPIHYDLVINTEHLSFEAAASIVVNTIPLKD